MPSRSDSEVSSHSGVSAHSASDVQYGDLIYSDSGYFSYGGVSHHSHPDTVSVHSQVPIRLASFSYMFSENNFTKYISTLQAEQSYRFLSTDSKQITPIILVQVNGHFERTAAIISTV